MEPEARRYFHLIAPVGIMLSKSYSTHAFHTIPLKLTAVLSLHLHPGAQMNLSLIYFN
jgi:hypothetical protein